MKVLYQWSKKNPEQWQQIAAKDWATLPKRPVPNKGELGGLDNVDGWLRNVNVQGITTEGYDHVAIEPIKIGNDEGVKMIVWNDDKDDAHVEGFEDWVNEPNAIVWTILPTAPDPKHGMAINTRQSCIRYAKGKRYDDLILNIPENTTVRPWFEFITPSENVTRHGVWLSNEKLSEHIAAAPHHEYGWMHWNEHLPESECEVDSTGKRVLKEQRKQGRYKQAEHTITYYQRSTARAAGYVVATNEVSLETTTATSSTQTVTTNATSITGWSFATATGAPNVSTWPTGSYHIQVNITTISAGLTVVNQTAGDSTKGFVVASSDLSTASQSLGRDSVNVYTGSTGLKLFTASLTPSAGSVNDRYSVNINTSGSSHGDAVTLTLNTTDSYADGPWSTNTVTSKTETGVARITATTTKTETGVGRVQVSTTKTITGKANVSKLVAQTETGVSRVTATTPKTITGVGNIRNTTSKTITGLSRVQKSSTQTIQGVSRVTATTSKTKTGTARVTATTPKTVTGISRVTATTTKTKSGVSRIQKSVTQTQTGLSRITATTSKTNTGLSRITATSTKTTTGKSRITATGSQTETGLSRIIQGSTKDITGVSRLTASSIKTETGISRITATKSRTLSGTARIASSTPPSGLIKVSLAGVWAEKPVKVSLGGVWTQKPLKKFIGSVWT